MKKFTLLILGISINIVISAQEKPPVKFGKISADDFKTKIYSIDSNAAAVVIADIGSTAIVGNSKGWFSLEFKHFKRIHILKQSGYDIANVEIPLYTNGNLEEQLENLKAYTYNLENGKVVESKLDIKTGVFKDKRSKNLVVKKFTFPSIKEGSIIEFDYTVTSDYLFNLQPWEFQGAYPRLWSEYNVTIPEFIYYVFLSQGSQYYFNKERQDRAENFRVSDSRGAGATEFINFNANVTDNRYIMKNVPALKAENFTSTLDNHIAKIEFQLAEYRQPLSPRNVMGNWVDVCKSLLKDENFGLQIGKDNGWLADDLNAATKGAATSIDKARSIYSYLQKQFTCTGYNRTGTDQVLKNILRDKKGSEAEINLLLIAMLRKADIAADPVMLSTKSHGYTFSLYPIMDKFNYVVCRAEIGDKVYYLDASRPRLGFGKLSWDCYNGHARIINEQATPIALESDSLYERKLTSVFFFNEEKGGYAGYLQQTPGYYESYSIRNRVKENGMDKLITDIKKDFGTEVEISNAKIDSLELLDESIQIVYDLKFNLEKEDILYINPMFGEAYKENYFKSAERTYPVEMPYVMDETYLLSMEVPEGYQIDELPKSVRLNFDEEGTSFFEYLISHSGGIISLRSRIKLTRSYFMPEEYDILREFFGFIVNKHGEQVVFKKKK